jgi:glycosyltransferase involved in cell wall biosynthesis
MFPTPYCGSRARGWRNDRGALLKTADVCLVPSRHEPFGNVVVNAWVHGIPIAACRSEGPGALIAHGEDGLLVPIDDAAALADAVKQILVDRNLKKKLVAGGRVKAARDYSESAVVAGYLEAFMTALANLPGRRKPA